MNTIDFEKTTITKTDRFEGGSKLGQIEISYFDLVNLFGEPNVGGSADGKTNCEWQLNVVDNTIDSEDYGYEGVLSIYDWKEDKNIQNVNSWNVGGNYKNLFLCLVEYIHENSNYNYKK